MQVYPDILGEDAVKDSRQMLLDRDDSLKTNFSGPTPPDVTFDDLGCMWFNTTDRQFYGLVDINEDGSNATWQKVANVSKLNLMDLGTPTSETLYVDLVGENCETKEDMMVLVEHTILPTENYEITEMGKRVTFVSPIPANLKLELRWFSKTIVGRDGATFVPKVENGVLSWDNDQELPNPEPLDFNEAQAGVTAEGTKQVGLVIAEGANQISKIQNTFDTERAEGLEEYNNNATNKTNDFNTNATSKTTAFDNNAASKTTTFNDNATSKTNDFNANAEVEIAKARAWSTGTDEEVQAIEADEHSSRVYAEASKSWAEASSNSASEAAQSQQQCQDILDRLGTVIKVKGRVDTINDLPTENNLDGDCYLVGYVNAGQFQEYYWFSDHWEFLGVAGDTLNWGAIQGNIENQEDLAQQLNSKVSLTGDQDIAGLKNFLNNMRCQRQIDYGYQGGNLYHHTPNVDVNVAPEANNYNNFNFVDKHNTRWAALEAEQNTDGRLRLRIQANRAIDGVQKYAQLTVEIYPDGTIKATAPGPNASSANDNQIATAYWTNSRITDIMNTFLPAGMVMPYMGNTIPSGWLDCNGQSVSRTTYAKLFAAIGTKYGTGDGSTTFGLPNMTNRYLMGSQTVGTYIEAGLPDITHTHSTSYRYKDPSLSGGGNNGVGGGSGWFNFANESSTSGNNSGVSSIYGKSNTVTPLTLTVRYLIKY